MMPPERPKATAMMTYAMGGRDPIRALQQDPQRPDDGDDGDDQQHAC